MKANGGLGKRLKEPHVDLVHKALEALHGLTSEAVYEVAMDLFDCLCRFDLNEDDFADHFAQQYGRDSGTTQLHNHDYLAAL